MQLISVMDQIFRESSDTNKLWLRPYEIIATNPGCGIIEFLEDSMSLDYIKRRLDERGSGQGTLKEYFETNFGLRGTKGFENAVKSFTYSLSAYSLVCYILQIKDRHNANILLDNEGHIIHIDFGFMLTNYPKMKIEQVPFKLTEEMMDLLGGDNSDEFRRFYRYFSA